MFGIVTENVKIITGNSGFSITTSLIEVLPSDCENDGQPEMTRFAPKTSILAFPVVGRCRNGPEIISSSSAWLKTPIWRWNFDVIWHNSTDISISGFRGRNIRYFRLSAAIAITRRTFFRLSLVINPRFVVGILMVSLIVSYI